VIVAEGWLDFVYGGGDQPLFVFWLFLTLMSGSEERKVKADAQIPEHVWQRLPETTRSLCAREDAYDARWAKDPKVVAWRRGHAT
jgi:hypothetical protein